MIWTDIASIIFVCVTANHLGLVEAIEKAIGCRLHVVDCPKCLTFWVTMLYCCDTVASYETLITVLAISFAASYLALWLELAEGYIDTLYVMLYDKIYGTTADTVASDAEQGDTQGTVS